MWKEKKGKTKATNARFNNGKKDLLRNEDYMKTGKVGKDRTADLSVD